MAQRVTQAGTQTSDEQQRAADLAALSQPGLEQQILGGLGAGILGVGGGVMGLGRGLAGVNDRGLADIFPSIGRGIKEGAGAGYWLGSGELEGPNWEQIKYGTEGAAARAAEQAVPRTGYLETLLGGTPTFNREQYLAQADPRLSAQIAAYDRMMAALRPEVEQAKAAVAGAYGQAAGAGRTAARNIGARGERTGATFEDLYGRAATEAGDLAQAGGTAVSGLTGPGQAFQDIYGGAYGLGGTEAYGARGEAGLAAEGMRAQAQQAAGAGSRAAENIQNYWDRMTARERWAFESAIADAQFQRAEGLKLKEEQLALTTGSLVGMYRDNKDMRNSLKKQFGSVTDQNYNTEIPRLLNQLSATYGPEAVLRTLTQSGLAFGAKGG